MDEHVAAVNSRVDQVSAKVDQVNGKVDALSTRVDGVDASAKAAHARADEAYAHSQGTMTTSVVAKDEVTFETNQWTLSDEAKTKLTGIADKLKADNKNVFVELIGHADTRGPELKNRVLGEKRALEVRHFLFDQGIPLNHLESVSWGEAKPKAEGKTAEAHTSNRRVRSDRAAVGRPSASLRPGTSRTSPRPLALAPRGAACRPRPGTSPQSTPPPHPNPHRGGRATAANPPRRLEDQSAPGVARCPSGSAILGCAVPDSSPIGDCNVL